MRILVCLIAALFFGCSENAETSPQEETLGMDPKLREILSLPKGIEVTHSPNPVRAELGGRSRHKYTWIYETTVRASSGPVRVTEFGSFGWYEGEWVFTNFTDKPFTAVEFADWYSCKDALLLPNRFYSDPNNWSGSEDLRAGRAKWYFIGVDQDGKRVAGHAEVERLPELRR